MKIKRYLAPDMRRAMRQVRDQQGPDAVILSSKRLDDGVEVIAAIDYDASLMDPTTGHSKLTSAEKPASDIAFGQAADNWSQRSDPSLASMQNEVASLRELLESQLASLAWNETVRQHPQRASITRELLALGITPQLAEELAKTAGEQHSESAEVVAVNLLRDRLPILQEEIFEQPGAVALVGPTGVGKTTTIAKLAARFVLKNGAESLGLLTTDGFRVGAQEQLMTFGRILGVPVELVRDSAELGTALDTMSDKKLVLIDTAGMSQRDRTIHKELAAISENKARTRVLLTLSGNAQPAVLEETVQAFEYLQPTACVLTKIDEAASLGGALSAVIRHKLPLAYLTDGQRVPEDLRWAGGKQLDLITHAATLASGDTLQSTGEVLAHA